MTKKLISMLIKSEISFTKYVQSFPKYNCPIVEAVYIRTLYELVGLKVMLWNLICLILTVLVIKDPCKKCLIRACCNKKCEERLFLEKFILKGDNTLYFKKILCLLVIIMFSFIWITVVLLLIGRF